MGEQEHIRKGEGEGAVLRGYNRTQWNELGQSWDAEIQPELL